MKIIKTLLAIVGFIAAFSAAPARAQTEVIAQCPLASAVWNTKQTGHPFYLDTFGNLCIAGTLTIVPSGTQNVNLTQILGAAPSATNPLWVAPATAATPWVITGSGTAGTAAAGVATVQGIASMTPFLTNPGTAALWNTAWAGGTLGAMANYGTSPGAVLVPGVNAFITNSIKLLDTGGTNVASIKAASTAPATTDTSIVVAQSPNGADPCQNPAVAKSSAAISISTATTTSLVAVSGSTTVYVCGFSVAISEVVTTANTILFEYGVGAACTSPTSLTGAYGSGGVTAGAPIVISAYPGHTIFKSAASAGICALTTIGGSGSFQGVLTYVQQ